MADLHIEKVDGGVVFTAKVVPGSSKTVATGLLGGMVKIRVSAAAEKGKANKCLVDFLAKALDVRRSEIDIIRGQSNPVKAVRVLGISAESLLEKLGLNR